MTNVLLMTVTKTGESEPIAHGIYKDIPQSLQQLNVMGIHPGFDSDEYRLFDEGGKQTGALIATDKFTVSLAVMTEEEAAQIARNEPLMVVPDTLEGIDA